MKPTLAALAVLVIAAPVVQAGFEWWNPTTWDDALDAPDPKPYTEGADLSDVLDKVQVTRITGITALSVVDFDEIALMLLPETGQLTIRQSPKAHVAEGRPVQSTALAPTTDLVLVTGAFYSYYAGASPNPPDADADPSFLFHNLSTRLSVPNVVPLEDVAPNAIVGPATMTTETLDVTPVTGGLRDNPAVLSLLDVDGELSVLEAAPTYDAGATITTATTDAGMKAILDEVGVVGATLSGVLTALSGSSAPEVGAVNSDGVANALATRGYTLRKIVSPVDEPQAVYVPDAKQLDLVNPTGFTGELVFVATPELKDVGEDRIIALKGATSTAPTQVLVLFDSMDLTLTDCACYALLKFDPALAGITEAYEDLLDAPKRIDNNAILVDVDPDHRDEYVPSTLPGAGFDKLFIVDMPGKLDANVLGDVLGRERFEPPTDSDLPGLWGDSLIYLIDDLDAARIDKDLLDAKVHLPWGDFTTWVPKAPKMDPVNPKNTPDLGLDDYLGQLQSLDVRELIPVGEPTPSGLEPIGVDAADGLLMVVEEGAARDHADAVWSSLQIRTTTREARAPVQGANVHVEVYTPAYHGGTVQEFDGETNTIGYVSFTVMPASLYNATATKEDFLDAVALGATGGPGEETGKEMQMTPRGGWEGFVDQLAQGPVILIGSIAALAALVIFARTRRGRRLLGRFRGRARRRFK